MMVIFLIILIWLISGYVSFIYWYSKEYNITLLELIFGLIPAACGPFAFILGFMIHGEPVSNTLKINFNKVIIKKRKQ